MKHVSEMSHEELEEYGLFLFMNGKSREGWCILGSSFDKMIVDGIKDAEAKKMADSKTKKPPN